MTPLSFGELQAAAWGAREAIEGPAMPIIYRCIGRMGCDAVVATRNSVCHLCEKEMSVECRRSLLAPAQASLAGAAWCHANNPEYQRATRKIRAAVAALANVDERQFGERLIDGAWHRDYGGVLLLGPTGIGKSRVLAAIGARILSAAETGILSSNVEAFKFACGIRYMHGVELARAREEHRLGGGEPPLLAEARRATLLLLDEVGFEDQGRDPGMVRDLLRYRYEHKLIYRPTILASGSTLTDLHRDYGEAAIRLIHERGHLLDLHSRAHGRTKVTPR